MANWREGLRAVMIDDNAAIALLRSPEVRAELERLGQQIAEAAGGGEDYVVDVGQTSTRAHVRVYTATGKARRAEATDRTLLRALDAGRG